MAEFRITGPGKYRNRCGEVKNLSPAPTNDAHYRWIDESGNTYMSDGHFDINQAVTSHDLIEGPIADDTEMAGLTGFVRIPNGAEWNQIQLLSNVSDAGHENATVIDLSKIPASAIVRPEPKRETRKVALVMLKSGAVNQWWGTPPVASNHNPDIIAFVEREVEFTVGEGLAVKS